MMHFNYNCCCLVDLENQGFEVLNAHQTPMLSGKLFDKRVPGDDVSTQDTDSFDELEVEKSVLVDGGVDEFSVVIQKGPDPDSLALGLDVDFSDGPTLLVDAVHDGLIKQWNTAHPKQEVRCRDRIINVNGVRDDARKIIEELSSAETLNIYFKRPSEFSISVAKPHEQAEVGLDLKFSLGSATLLVDAVTDGIVDGWNRKNVSLALSKGDRIYEVNGFQGDAQKLYDVLTKSDQLELRCMKAVGLLI